jgi:hypothetical protein
VTPVENQDSTGGDVVATCLAVPDEFFFAKIQELATDQQAEFACPTEAAQSVNAEWLSFEHGIMVAVDGAPLVYVYYDSGAWEQVPTAENPQDERTPPEEGTREREALPQPFARVLASQGRAITLGELTSEEPLRAETLIQRFNGGVLLGNKDNGQILLLARSKLRF